MRRLIFLLTLLFILALTAPGAWRGVGVAAATGRLPNAYNQAPIAVEDLYVNAPAFTSPYTSPFSVLRNDIDYDGDQLTAQLAASPLYGSVQLHPNGTFIYFPPTFSLPAMDVFYYQVSDGQSASGPVKVMIDIGERNRPPVGVDDNFIVIWGSPLKASVVENDRDPDGDALTAHITQYPQHGTINNYELFRKFGVLDYTPGRFFFGTDFFTYVPADLEGDGEPAYVFIEVRPSSKALPAVQFGSGAYHVTEGCTATTITVSIDRPPDAPQSSVVVDYTVTGGTASPRGDYTVAGGGATAGQLAFVSGETTREITVLVSDDGYAEGQEAINFSLLNPFGATLGANSTTTLYFNDDETADSATNPIDDPATFVCQHYHDFLGRQPDDAGLAFWADQIAACGADAACVAEKRHNVSAAFFLSIEFQQTGSFVNRLYEACLGRHQTYEDFLRDMQRLGAGVEVGVGDWEQRLEANKWEFAREFVRRSEYQNRFPMWMPAEQYADRLFEYAGVPWRTDEEWRAVVEAYGVHHDRAAAMREAMESASVYRHYYNRGFVLAEYFGYLRRDPDSAGYDFWLTKMDAFSLSGEDVTTEGDAFARVMRGEMVRAFIESLEYRQRFGKP